MVISKLTLKLIRDIRFSPWLFLGIMVMVASGVALYDATYLSYYNLGRSYNLSYEKLNLADFTVDVQSAPQEITNQIKRIPGVMRVEGRFIEELGIEQKLSAKRVIGRIVSIPDKGQPSVNTLKIIRGHMPAPGNKRELLLEAGFAKYHGYKPGDVIYPIVDGDKVKFRISGIAMSPEYIVVVRSRDNPIPMPEQFGVMFIRKEIVDRLFGSSGTINQVAVKIFPGANRSRIMRQVEQVLQPYGAEEPLPKENQPSYEMLNLDLRALRNLAIFFPVLFLGMASLSIYNLLSRMVYAQRPQIGFMRATGYSRKAVLRHYVAFSLLIGILGSLFGSLLGYRMGEYITNLDVSQLSVPYVDTQPRFEVMMVGFLISIIVTFLAGLVPALTASRMTPAEAIRPEIPMAGRVPIIENLLPALKQLSYTWRLPLRNLLRRPKRTISTILGVASSITLILVTLGLIDSSKALVSFYFDRLLKYNLLVGFVTIQTESPLGLVRTWKGVERAEPFLQVPVKFIHNGNQKFGLIFGVDPNTRLLNPISFEGNKRISVPKKGILIGDLLAMKLNLTPGQYVTITLPKKTTPQLPISEDGGAQVSRFRDEVFSRSRGLQEITFKTLVPVVNRSFQPIGNIAIMSIFETRHIFGKELELPPHAINAILIKADDRYVSAIQRRLYDLPDAASVANLKDMRYEINEMMKTLNIFTDVMLTFAIALASIIIFNATTMNILERTREFASMRALGVGSWKIAAMVTIENLSTWVAGTIIGLPIGRQLADYFVKLYTSEAFHMQTVIFSRTYAWTLVGILAAVLISQIPGIRYLMTLDLASATKEVSG
ncbi:MAG: FtsX-like permease family protein [Armatimonadota bacterium]|nr:FtsX-like permease family protein [Armatimonadota bacterium]